MELPRRHRALFRISGPFAITAALASLAARSAALTSALHLGYGILGALFLMFAALLGLRKRWIRLRVGSASAWAAAHNWLGGLSLYFGLLHARFRFGGPLTGALLTFLVLSVLTGGIGIAIQSVVPRLMTSRLTDESPRMDLGPVFAEYWRSVHEIVASACGQGLPADQDLLRLESAHATRKNESRGESSLLLAGSVEGQNALASFYQGTIVPFFRAPLAHHPAISSEADSTVVFDALRGGVDPLLHGPIEQIRRICTQARQRAEEARFRRMLEGWVLLHIPLAMISLVLLVAHILAALYY